MRPWSAVCLTLSLLTTLLVAAPTGAQAPTCTVQFDGGPDTTGPFTGIELGMGVNWVGDMLPQPTQYACVGDNFGGGLTLSSGVQLVVSGLQTFTPVDVSNGGLTLGSQPSSLPSVTVRSAGSLTLQGTLSLAQPGEVTVQPGGTVGGQGSIDNSLRNAGGTIAPGSPTGQIAGQLSVTGSVQQESGTLRIRIVDPLSDSIPNDRIEVPSATLGGQVSVVVAAGYTPPVGTEFTIVRQPPAQPLAHDPMFVQTPYSQTLTVVDNNPDVDFVAETRTNPHAIVLRTVQQAPPPPPPEDPLRVTLSAGPAERGPSGTADVPLTATLNRPTTTDVDVTVQITGGGTTFAQADPVGTIKVPAGDTAASIALGIANDTPPPVTATIQSVQPSTVLGQGQSTEVTLTNPPPAGAPVSLDDPSIVPISFDDTCLVDVDGLGVAKADPLSTAQIALGSLDCAAPAELDQIVLGRDDDFADSLSSGILQADSPLLLIPGDGPVPQEVLDALEDLGVSRVVIMGGPAAIGEQVEDELAGMGITVERREGPTRIETALDVAATDAADATTAIVARAFAGGADPSQAFADAIAAGGMAADRRYPVLLTDSAGLSQSTADYLAGSQITDVLIMGGTAAVSDAVQAELQAIVPGTVTRVAGDSRFGTSVEVAKARGIDSAADAAQILLVEGQDDEAWAGGLTAAFAAARDDAPIVLLNGDQVPAETAAFLTGEPDTGAAFAVEVGEDVVTCAAVAEGCVEARRLLGLEGRPVLFDPPSLSPVAAGDAIALTFPEGVPSAGDTVFGGTCLAAATRDLARVVISADAPLPCTVTVTITYPTGEVQRSTAAYTAG